MRPEPSQASTFAEQYARMTLRYALPGYLAFATYHLFGLLLSRSGGLETLAYVVASAFQECSIVLALAAVFGGAWAGARGAAPREVVRPITIVAVVAVLGYGLVDPIWEYVTQRFLLGSQSSFGIRFPWTSLRLAAETDPSEAAIEGASRLIIPTVLILNAISSLWVGAVAALNGYSGFLLGRTTDASTISTRAWALTLVSGLGFLGGVSTSLRLARSGSSLTILLAVLPLVVPVTVFLTLLATASRVGGPEVNE